MQRIFCLAALLLTCAHSLIGYAQTDDGKKENANDDGSVLSAVKAQGAVNRVDIAASYIEQAPTDQAVVEFKYTKIIGSHHQVTVLAPLVDSDIDSGSGLRAGDLKFGYSFTPNQKLTANPFSARCPADRRRITLMSGRLVFTSRLITADKPNEAAGLQEKD